MKNNNETFDWLSQDAMLMYILLIFIVVSKFYNYLDKIESAVSNSISAWKIVALVVLILAVPIIINMVIYVRIVRRIVKKIKEEQSSRSVNIKSLKRDLECRTIFTPNYSEDLKSIILYIFIDSKKGMKRQRENSMSENKSSVKDANIKSNLNVYHIIIFIVVIIIPMIVLAFIHLTNASNPVPSNDLSNLVSPNFTEDIPKGYLSIISINKVIKSKQDLPIKVLKSANSFINNLTENSQQSPPIHPPIHFRKCILVNNAGEMEYLTSYSFQVEKIKENGKIIISKYALRIRIDSSGNIINRKEVAEKYRYLISR